MPNTTMPLEIVKTTTISSGGSTTTGVVKIPHAIGPVSLFLYGETSADTTVTYEIGYKRDEGSDTVTYITPDGGTAITNLTNVDFTSSSDTHASISIPSGRWYKFTITNDDGGNDAENVQLKAEYVL